MKEKKVKRTTISNVCLLLIFSVDTCIYTCIMLENIHKCHCRKENGKNKAKQNKGYEKKYENNI